MKITCIVCGTKENMEHKHTVFCSENCRLKSNVVPDARVRNKAGVLIGLGLNLKDIAEALNITEWDVMNHLETIKLSPRQYSRNVVTIQNWPTIQKIDEMDLVPKGGLNPLWRLPYNK